MPKTATVLVVAALTGIGAAAGWWLLSRNRAQAGGGIPPTLEILTPPVGTSSPSGTRIDFSARAMTGAQDISDLIHWKIIEPDFLAGEWATGATTFVIPTFLQTRILTMEAYVFDQAGNSASVQRSVTVTVATSLGLPGLGAARGPAVSRVVPSFRRSDTGWQVRGRHVLKEPWEFARR